MCWWCFDESAVLENGRGAAQSFDLMAAPGEGHRAGVWGVGMGRAREEDEPKMRLRAWLCVCAEAEDECEGVALTRRWCVVCVE